MKIHSEACDKNVEKTVGKLECICLVNVSTDDLNYLIMLISHGDDVGASLESIIAELNRRAGWVR